MAALLKMLYAALKGFSTILCPGSPGYFCHLFKVLACAQLWPCLMMYQGLLLTAKDMLHSRHISNKVQRCNMTHCSTVPFKMLRFDPWIYRARLRRFLLKLQSLLNISLWRYLPFGISLSFLILLPPPPRPSVLNGHHSHSLIGECEFCHYLINVQVSARSGSSAPVGTSVHAHPCSQWRCQTQKRLTRTHTHTLSPICTCKLLSFWLLKAKLGRL